MIFQHNHSQLIEYPTHRQGNIIDLIITTYDENIANLQIHTEENPLLTSDHFPITFYLSLPHNCTDATDNNSINVLDYSNADFDLSHVDFLFCFHSSDVEYVWAAIKETLLNTIHLFVPELKIKLKAFPRWFTSSLKHKTKYLRTLRKRYSRFPTFHVKAHLQAIEIEVAEETAAPRSAGSSRTLLTVINQRYLAI